LTTAGLVLVSTAARAQYYQTDFPADEFRSRHAKRFEQIGASTVAVVQGMPLEAQVKRVAGWDVTVSVQVVRESATREKSDVV
jgi:hypothetical protein